MPQLIFFIALTAGLSLSQRGLCTVDNNASGSNINHAKTDGGNGTSPRERGTLEAKMHSAFGEACTRELVTMRSNQAGSGKDEPPKSLHIPQIMDHLHVKERASEDFPGGRDWFEDCYALEYFWKPLSKCLATYRAQNRRNEEERKAALKIFRTCYTTETGATIEKIADTLAGAKPAVGTTPAQKQ